MTSLHGEQRRTASESVTLNDLTAQALTAPQAAGLDFESLELDAGFRRKPRHDHLWYVADTGAGRNGQPWLMTAAPRIGPQNREVRSEPKRGCIASKARRERIRFALPEGAGWGLISPHSKPSTVPWVCPEDAAM